MHPWSINLWQRKQDYTMLERVSSTNGAGKTVQLHIKSEIRSFCNTVHKNKLKME